MGNEEKDTANLIAMNQKSKEVYEFDSESKVTTEKREFDFVDVFWMEDISR